MAKSQRNIRNTTVAVAGGCGFLGSHLVHHLIEDRGCKVVVLDNLLTGKKEHLHPKAIFEYCDITGSELRMKHLLEHYGVEYVFNYVAEPYIPVSFERPLHVINTNAFGAIQLINAAHEAGVAGILQVSSAEIYGDGASFGEIEVNSKKITEYSPVNPHSSYGVAKAAIDFYVQARWRESGTRAIAIRQFNCVGERETHPYVVPEIISQIGRGEPEMLNGLPILSEGQRTHVVKLGNNSFRDFLYAMDAVKMAAELLEKGQFGEVYNSGSEQGIHIFDLALLIGKLMGVQVRVEEDAARKRPWEIWHLQSDNTKLYDVIDYRPETTLEEMLKKTIAYFHANGNRWDWV